MKKVILSLVMLLFAVCVSGQVYNLNGDDVTDDYVKGKAGTYIVNGRKCVVSDGRTTEEIMKELEERLNAEMEKRETARRLCEDVPLEKYDKKVCEYIYVFVNRYKVSKEEYQDLLMFLSKKGISCKIDIGTPVRRYDDSGDYAVMLYTHDIEKYKIGIKELNYADLIKCLNALYHEVEDDKTVEKHGYGFPTVRDVSAEMNARQNYYGAMYRLTGNIGFITNGILL